MPKCSVARRIPIPFFVEATARRCPHVLSATSVSRTPGKSVVVSSAGRIVLGIEGDCIGDSVVMLTREEVRKCLLQRFADEPVDILFPVSIKPQCAQRPELCPGDVPAGNPSVFRQNQR